MTVTDDDMKAASAAMNVGHDNCCCTKFRETGVRRLTNCDMGATDGCIARREAIAEAIAAARGSGVVGRQGETQ